MVHCDNNSEISNLYFGKNNQVCVVLSHGYKYFGIIRFRLSKYKQSHQPLHEVYRFQ